VPLVTADPTFYTPLTKTAERCRSGRSGRSRKPLMVQAIRGFESHPLRQPPPTLVSVSGSLLQTRGTGRLSGVLPALGRRLGAPFGSRPRGFQRAVSGGPQQGGVCLFQAIIRENPKFQPQSRPFRSSQAPAPYNLSHDFSRLRSQRAPIPCYCPEQAFCSAEQGAVYLVSGIGVADNRDAVAPDLSWLGAPQPTAAAIALCWSAQPSGSSSAIRSASVSPGGWRPSRMVRCRSGARNARRSSRRL
jgi:hypothetical protein